VFVTYYDDCALELQGHAAELPLPQFAGFYASCQELASGAGQMLQPFAVQMFRVLVNTEGAAQAGGMFPGGGMGGDGGGGYGRPLDPLQPVTPVPPPPPPDAGAEDGTGLQQYHAVCTSADVASCVPPCNAEHHGYELLATIDGTDTKFSCNLAHGLFSWMGAASEGGYLGSDSASFLSAVVSGAAGSYIVTLTADAGIGTDLVIEPGQNVRVSGDPGLAVAPSWGSGGFVVSERGSLALTYVALSSPVSMTAAAGPVHLTGCVLNFVAEAAFIGVAAATGSSDTCPEIPAFTNGAIAYSNSGAQAVGFVATTGCAAVSDNGFRSRPNSVQRTCTAGGSWDSANPVCKQCSSEAQYCRCSQTPIGCLSCCGGCCCGASPDDCQFDCLC
jgi:hypothetical protein